MTNKLHFDVMVNDKFICTMHMPIHLGMISGYKNNKPVINLGMGGAFLKEYVISQRPSLKNKDFNIIF